MYPADPGSPLLMLHDVAAPYTYTTQKHMWQPPTRVSSCPWNSAASSGLSAMARFRASCAAEGDRRLLSLTVS